MSKTNLLTHDAKGAHGQSVLDPGHEGFQSLFLLLSLLLLALLLPFLLLFALIGHLQQNKLLDIDLLSKRVEGI